jgi:hypothetical protein
MDVQFAVMKPQSHDIQSHDIQNHGIQSHDHGHVQEVVQQAHVELQHLLQQRAEVTRRIGTVKQTISGLANLFGEDVLSDDLLELVDRKTTRRQPGFTKVCRRILLNANCSLSSREVCDRILKETPQVLQRHKDPTASVTTVLNRLVAYGEAKAVTLENGRRGWQWVCDSETAMLPQALISAAAQQ